jgi:pyruvate carboxylase subunit B
MRKFRITLEDEVFEVGIEEIKEARKSKAASGAAKGASAAASPKAAGSGGIRAVSPCTIASIKVTVGDSVNAGDTVLITESMKMQTTVTSPIAGAVISIHVEEGQYVKRNDLLVTIE